MPDPLSIRGRVPMSNLALTERLAAERYGADSVKIIEQQGGIPGVVDKKDKMVVVKDGKAIEKTIGVRRAEDLRMRTHVVKAAKDLAAGGASFSGSADTDKVNEKLWTMGYGGRMQVRKFMPDGTIGKPADALRDIFTNGRSYGFECATAMMVIYHKAILDHVGDDAFNKMFAEPKQLTFFRWSVEDKDFTDVKKLVHKPTPLVPGSHYYYKNPDAAPENSAFSGENVLYLGDGQFYAHGIIGNSGTYIVTEKDIMETLTRLRKPGATIMPRREAMEMWVDGFAMSKKAFPDGVPL